jgi:hypothetical protein
MRVPADGVSHVVTTVIRGFGAPVRSPDTSGSSLKGTGLSLRPSRLTGRCRESIGTCEQTCRPRTRRTS